MANPIYLWRNILIISFYISIAVCATSQCLLTLCSGRWHNFLWKSESLLLFIEQANRLTSPKQGCISVYTHSHRTISPLFLNSPSPHNFTNGSKMDLHMTEFSKYIRIHWLYEVEGWIHPSISHCQLQHLFWNSIFKLPIGLPIAICFSIWIKRQCFLFPFPGIRYPECVCVLSLPAPE